MYFYTVAFIRILSMAYQGVRMLCVVFYRIKVLSVMCIRRCWRCVFLFYLLRNSLWVMLFSCESSFVGLLMCVHHCLLGFRCLSISLPTSLGATGVAEFGALGFAVLVVSWLCGTDVLVVQFFSYYSLIGNNQLLCVISKYIIITFDCYDYCSLIGEQSIVVRNQ